MKNEYKITKALIKAWAKEYHLHGTSNIVLFVLWCLVGVIAAEGLLASIVMPSDWFAIYLFSVLLILAIYKLFISRFVIWSNRYKLSCTTYGVTEWMRTTEFLDDEIVLTDHTSVSKFQYSNIEKIKEKDNVIMIFMNHNIALRLYKDAFVVGSWDECKKMILEKKKDQSL